MTCGPQPPALRRGRGTARRKWSAPTASLRGSRYDSSSRVRRQLQQLLGPPKELHVYESAAHSRMLSSTHDCVILRLELLMEALLMCN